MAVGSAGGAGWVGPGSGGGYVWGHWGKRRRTEGRGRGGRREGEAPETAVRGVAGRGRGREALEPENMDLHCKMACPG